MISFRCNRIDSLGMRSMNNICKAIPGLKELDVRNNDIPHYANFKGMSSIISFF
jgi:hypothetical protein